MRRFTISMVQPKLPST